MFGAVSTWDVGQVSAQTTGQSTELPNQNDTNLPGGAPDQTNVTAIPSVNVPNSCKVPTGEFAECPSTYYKFDYIGKKASVTDVSSLFQEGFHQGFTFFLNLIWYAYTILIYAVIYVFTFSYRLELMTDFSNSMQSVLGQSDSLIWGGVFPWLAGVVALVVLWKFIRRHNQDGFSLLFRNILIVTCASYFFTQIPTVVSKVSDVTGKVSDYTLAGFLSITPKNENSTITEAQIEQEQKNAIQKVSSALWSEFYYKPYLVLQFGSIEAGQKYVGQLFSYGADADHKRREWFTGYNEETEQQTGAKYVDYETGVAQSDEFKMATSAGVMKRFGYSIFILLMGISFAVMLFVFSWKLLHWFFLAIGRVLLLVVPVLFSMIPGRSLGDVTHWLWQILYAFFMRVLLASILGIAITLFVVIQGVSITDGGEFSYLVTFVMRSILILASFMATWTIMKEIQWQLQGLVGLEIAQPNWSDLWNGVRTIWRRGSQEEKIDLSLLTHKGISIVAIASAQKRSGVRAWIEQWKKGRAIRRQSSLSKTPPQERVNE